jgi:alpha-maltose-1-phosphate synthase
MTILFGHPCGNPNSHNAALAHLNAHRLEAFCVPWMPSAQTVYLLQHLSPLRSMAARLSRRHFLPLAAAPKIQGKFGEMRRLLTRALSDEREALAYEANDWLMNVMSDACKRTCVTAVHSYEDCALRQFVEAKRLGKACIYDMPIGYYPAWEETQRDLATKFTEWLPDSGPSHIKYVRPRQKRDEMELADLVLVPSTFVAQTIQRFQPKKTLALAPYGVDLTFWNEGVQKNPREALRFIYAGQISLRKGIPDLLSAWEKAAVPSAELRLVGHWMLSDKKKCALPKGVTYTPPCSPEALRGHYRQSDVFVFPSYFEGFGLALLEAMACGLPAIASDATAGADVITDTCGRVLPVGNVDALVEAFRWFDRNRNDISHMGAAARKRAEQFTWERYRRAVTDATSRFI